MKKIALTGGGTAGHVMPNIALLPELIKRGYEIIYIGSVNGMEKNLIASNGVAEIEYYGISSGKLRRYLDIKNLTDIFKVIKGLGEAYRILRKQKPDIVFSKGGFVIVPVVIAARLCGIPVIIHESDISPGLANRISMPFASGVCVSFPETVGMLPKGRAHLTGTPIRRELFDGDRARGLSICGFDASKPVALVMGGSSGAVKINECLRRALPELIKNMSVAHICGRGNVDTGCCHNGYRQFEYVSDELPHLFAAADIVISRAGANSINELLALQKPNLLIPLSRAASRGDQIANAKSFEARGYSMVLSEEEMDEKSLAAHITALYADRDKYIKSMSGAGESGAGSAGAGIKNGVSEIIKIIERY